MTPFPGLPFLFFCCFFFLFFVCVHVQYYNKTEEKEKLNGGGLHGNEAGPSTYNKHALLKSEHYSFD